MTPLPTPAQISRALLTVSLLAGLVAVNGCERACPQGFKLNDGGRCIQESCTTNITYVEPGGSPPCLPTCGDDTTCCDGQCIDPATDVDHCGSCGHDCDADETCSEGECVTATDDGCTLASCSCQFFAYSCATMSFTTVTDYDDYGRISGITVSYSNGREVACGYTWGTDGTCTASCTDGSGASC